MRKKFNTFYLSSFMSSCRENCDKLTTQTHNIKKHGKSLSSKSSQLNICMEFFSVFNCVILPYLLRCMNSLFQSIEAAANFYCM